MAIKRDTFFFLVCLVFRGWNFCAHTRSHTHKRSSPRTHALFCCFVHKWCCYTTILVVLLLSYFCCFSTHTHKPNKNNIHMRTLAHTPFRIRRKSRITGHTTRLGARSIFFHHHATGARLLSFRFFFAPSFKNTQTNPPLSLFLVLFCFVVVTGKA